MRACGKKDRYPIQVHAFCPTPAYCPSPLVLLPLLTSLLHLVLLPTAREKLDCFLSRILVVGAGLRARCDHLAKVLHSLRRSARAEVAFSEHVVVHQVRLLQALCRLRADGIESLRV